MLNNSKILTVWSYFNSEFKFKLFSYYFLLIKLKKFRCFEFSLLFLTLRHILLHFSDSFLDCISGRGAGLVVQSSTRTT